MSHFSVVVCIDGSSEILARAQRVEADGFATMPPAIEECVRQLMEPYDENREVAPYEDYEDGGPADFWLYKSLQRAAEDYAAGTGIKPYEPDGIGWSSASSKQTPAQQREELRKDAELLATLPSPVTWEAIAELYNERYGEDGGALHVTGDGQRAYTISTRNQDAKWDYWRIGGRWGGYFPYKAENARLVLRPESGWDSPGIKPLHCDGGPKSALDLTGLREEKAEHARKTYAEFHALVDGTPEAQPWSHFIAERDAGRVTIDEARDLYHDQPRVKAMAGTDFRWMDDPIGTFGQPEDRYVAIEVARAVPGYAVVKTDGKWMAPGRMGWFGASTDDESERIGYWEASNAYIESLPDTAYLVAVDCHI